MTQMIVNQRLARLIEDIRVYRIAVIDFKSKDNHLVVSGANFERKFRTSNCLLRSYDIGDSRMRF